MNATPDLDDRIPLLPADALRDIRRADKKLYRALGALCGRAAAQVVREAPQDLLLWIYLTGISHGAAIERRTGKAIRYLEAPAADLIEGDAR